GATSRVAQSLEESRSARGTYLEPAMPGRPGPGSRYLPPPVTAPVSTPRKKERFCCFMLEKVQVWVLLCRGMPSRGNPEEDFYPIPVEWFKFFL
ncbi:MAG: hypothetical protein JXR77_18015, partial [Lentisphaeria bacterium]|nr:hypothetical protein [Lentisphaeria bacterium]